MVNGVHVGGWLTCCVTSLISDTISCISLLRLPPQCSTFSSDLLQCLQALVHSQSISQRSSSRISNSIPYKTVEEWVDSVLCGCGFMLIDYGDNHSTIPQWRAVKLIYYLKLAGLFLGLQHSCSSVCIQYVTQQEQNLILITLYHGVR